MGIVAFKAASARLFFKTGLTEGAGDGFRWESLDARRDPGSLAAFGDVLFPAGLVDLWLDLLESAPSSLEENKKKLLDFSFSDVSVEVCWHKQGN